MKINIISSLFLVLFLVGCSAISAPTSTPTLPEPTSTFTPLPTNTPTITPVPPTETPSEPVLPTPSGKPASEWEGIPVMPDAIAGDGDSQGYSFTVNASPDEIQQFYQKELEKLGWNLLASGKGTTNAVIMIFTNDTGTASVSIFPQPDGIMLVMLVK